MFKKVGADVTQTPRSPRPISYTAGISRGGDGAKSLLPGRVPDLQLDLLAGDGHRPDLEVHADCGDVVARERVVSEPDEQGALAHACKRPCF